MNDTSIAIQTTAQVDTMTTPRTIETNQNIYRRTQIEMMNRYARYVTISPLYDVVESNRSCKNCKHYFHHSNYDWCAKLEYFSMKECRESYRYWELKQEYKKEMSQFLKIPDNVFTVDYGEDIDKCPKNILTIEANMANALSAYGNTQDKMCLTLDDLYSLAFPLDPIQEYFSNVYKQIEEEYKKEKEILERIKANPVERIELVETTDKSNNKSYNIQSWIWCETIIVTFVLLGYLIGIVLCVLCGEAFIEITAFCITLFVVLSAVNALDTVFEWKYNI